MDLWIIQCENQDLFWNCKILKDGGLSQDGQLFSCGWKVEVKGPKFRWMGSKRKVEVSKAKDKLEWKRGGEAHLRGGSWQRIGWGRVDYICFIIFYKSPTCVIVGGCILDTDSLRVEKEKNGVDWRRENNHDLPRFHQVSCRVPLSLKKIRTLIKTCL